MRIESGDTRVIVALEGNDLVVCLPLAVEPAVAFGRTREDDTQSSHTVGKKSRLAFPVGDRRSVDHGFRYLVAGDAIDPDENGANLVIGVHRRNGIGVLLECLRDGYEGFRIEQFDQILRLGQVQIHGKDLFSLARNCICP